MNVTGMQLQKTIEFISPSLNNNRLAQKQRNRKEGNLNPKEAESQALRISLNKSRFFLLWVTL